MKKIKTVALTGATGFIGINILGVLVRQDIRIRALYRCHSSHKRPDLPGISWIEGDLADSGSLKNLVEGADALIHCAGLTKATRPEDFFRVNTDGTKNLLQIIQEYGLIRRFLFISSLAARHPELSPYATSKLRAEQLVKNECRVPWTILRPPAVYGPGDREILPLFKAMDKGIALIPAPTSNRFSLLHVSDLAEAVLELIQSLECKEETIEIHDGTPGGYSWNDVINIFETVKGKRVFAIRIPPSLLKAIGLVGVAVSALSSQPTMITSWKVRELLHPNWVCNNGMKDNRMAWSPRFTLKIALENDLVG